MSKIGMMEKELGMQDRDDLSALTSMANLASTHRSNGQGQEAEEVGTKVMEASSTVLGNEHPDTILSMKNLAFTYRSQER